MSVLSSSVLAKKKILSLADLHEEFFGHLKRSSMMPLLRRNPSSFPPYFLLPGRLRGRFWARDVIDAWFAKLAQPTVNVVADMPNSQPILHKKWKGRRGRPPKRAHSAIAPPPEPVPRSRAGRLSNSVQYFPLVSAQLFPLYRLAENDFCAV